MDQRVVVSQASLDRPVGPKFPWFLALLIGIALGGTGGWFGQISIERSEATKYHSELLRPWLAYDKDYYKKRPRELNDDHRCVAFLVYQAFTDDCNLEEVLDLAMPTSQVPPPLKELTKKRLLENHAQAIGYGLYTEENLAKMFNGLAPFATQGEYAGEQMHSEHIVPKAVAPKMDNLLMNLEWLPASVNRSKSDTITERAMKFAQLYHKAGIMGTEEFIKVEKQFEIDSGKR